MYPDFQGRGTLGEFGHKLSEKYAKREGVVLVPIFNGLPEPELNLIASDAKGLGFSSVVCTEAGLVAALIAGYEHCVKVKPTDVVVRLDTAEHPIEKIDALAKKATEVNGLVIGDLSFTDETLVEGSLDEFAHLDLWPTMSRQILGCLRGSYEEGIGVSCAFGYEAFGGGVIRRLLPCAKKIVNRASEIAGMSVVWGFDMAMLASACALDVPVEIMLIPATAKRDRPREKIAQQLRGNLAMLIAALELRLKI